MSAAKIVIGVATQSEEDMIQRSADIKEAQAKEKSDAEAAAKHADELRTRGSALECPKGMVRVAVSTARAHFRAGRHWPAASPEVRETVADVTPDQLAALKVDHELAVRVVEKSKAAEK